MRSAVKPPELLLSLQQPDPRHRSTLTRSRVRRWVRAALSGDAQITVRVVDATEGLALNQAYRKQSHATNVLTFNYAREPVIVADLVLCAPVVAQEAREMRRTLEAHYAHLVVHGVLHAQGFDHIKASQAKRMEAQETEILAGLGVADPYAPKR